MSHLTTEENIFQNLTVLPNIVVSRIGSACQYRRLLLLSYIQPLTPLSPTVEDFIKRLGNLESFFLHSLIPDKARWPQT